MHASIFTALRLRLVGDFYGVKMRESKRADESGAPGTEPYHHGDLRAALIQAADQILAEHGLEGFSLREAARRAGVSAAAPKHHFGNAAGLLSEVAILGFEALASQLQVDPGEGTPAQRLRRQGIGYVRFALTHPGRFQLMFRHDLLNPDHPPLRQAGERTLLQLEETIRALRAIPPAQPLDADARAALLAAWATVHGFAHLALDGKLSQLYAGASHDDMLTDVLPRMLEGQWPDP